MATQTIFDRRCQLRATDPDHRCANRDGAEREATGLPALRPGSDCFLGARADLLREVNEINAQQAAIALAETVGRLLAVMRLYCVAEGDVEPDVDDTTDAMLAFQLAASVAAWVPRVRAA